MASRGARETRKDYLTRWATGFDPEVIVYWDTRDEQISLFGTVALVRSTNKHVIRCCRAGESPTGLERTPITNDVIVSRARRLDDAPGDSYDDR